MLTSAAVLKQTIAIPMLCVPTWKDPTSVAVKKDLPEMDQRVLVCISINNQ